MKSNNSRNYFGSVSVTSATNFPQTQRLSLSKRRPGTAPRKHPQDLSKSDRLSALSGGEENTDFNVFFYEAMERDAVAKRTTCDRISMTDPRTLAETSDDRIAVTENAEEKTETVTCGAANCKGISEMPLRSTKEIGTASDEERKIVREDSLHLIRLFI